MRTAMTAFTWLWIILVMPAMLVTNTYYLATNPPLRDHGSLAAVTAALFLVWLMATTVNVIAVIARD